MKPTQDSSQVAPSLFSTFISPGEILDWLVDDRISTALIDEAYDRWFKEDQEQAELYADCWKGLIHVNSGGGYDVWIEAEPFHAIHISASTLERCRSLIDDLRGFSEKLNALGWSDIVSGLARLDESNAIAIENLADEFITLLVGNNLVASLVKEIDGK